MSVVEELARFSPNQDTLLTIGVFDGVHLGHKYLLLQLMTQAREQNLLPGVVTFRQHPQEVLSGTRLPFLIDLDQRIKLLKDAGVELIVPLSFTTALARHSAHEFLGLLQKYLRLRGLVIGPDFALGKDREGNIDTIWALGRKTGFTVSVVPPVVIDGEVVSSTLIRQALAQGDMRKVSKMVGRPFSLHGRVVAGAGRGVRLGFPTANLKIDSAQAVPADGVYATWADINGRAYPSMTYIGKSPTFGDRERLVEVYILDYKDSLYGRELRIEIMERLRGDKRFASTEELKKQVMEDVRRGRAILGAKGN